MATTNTEKNYLADEDYMDVLKERLELVQCRIESIKAENHSNIFEEVSAYLGRLFYVKKEAEKEGISAGKVSADFLRDNAYLKKLHEIHDELFEDILGADYEKTYLNPDFSEERMGSLGAYLSALFMELKGLIPLAIEGNIEYLTIFSELFVEVYDIIKDAIGDSESDIEKAIKNLAQGKSDELKKSLEDSFHSFYHDYTEIFTRDDIVNLLHGDSYQMNILMQADLTNSDYLYAYGLPIGANELGIYNYLKDCSDSDINAMARTYVKGYIDGFKTTERDLSIKKTVRIIYPMGMERVARKSVELFKEAGLESLVHAPGAFSFNRRKGGRGASSSSENRQALYDHSDDKTIFYNRAVMERKREVMEDTLSKNSQRAKDLSGIAVIEVFGLEEFDPIVRKHALKYTEEDSRLITEFMSVYGEIQNKYIPGDETSFTIISYPVPSIGKDFKEIFTETVKLNNLDSDHYKELQQYLIDALDKGERVHVTGKNGNRTDVTVALHPVTDPAKETKFENCVADVNIPVGEVFTSPQLEGTNGRLHVSRVFLGGYEFRDLELIFKDGMVEKITCKNFSDEEANRKYIDDHILFHHKSLPLGEFAIGTNTTAYVMARKYNIESKMDILIAEKTGPHFAVGDTCYSYAEDVVVHNPDGKEIIARDNSVSLLRKTDPSKTYFHCHTDITIPYEELGKIEVLCQDGSSIVLIENGRFVLPGTEELNQPLDEFESEKM